MPNILIYLSGYDTYGTAQIPSRFGREKEYAQRAEPVINAGDFTQVQAARKRKTLLLLVFIVGV